MERIQKTVETYLPRIVEERSIPSRFGEAISYALGGKGKRIRPFLFLQAFTMYSSREEKALPFACAIEAIHTYSLVHDDLPVMDDDDFRRGRLTAHRVYGEANALLVGDALLTVACELMTSTGKDFPPRTVQKAMEVVLKASGPEGMVGGQYLDLKGEGRKLELFQLEEIHRSKTGALITASLLSGGILGEAPEEDLEALRTYGEELGLLFQITDDLLDVVGDPEKTGKAGKKDAELGKSTYPGLLGIKGAREKAEERRLFAEKAAGKLGKKGKIFIELANFVYYRDR